MQMIYMIFTVKSIDVCSWVNAGLVWDMGGGDVMIYKGVGSEHVLWLDDDCILMYYTGQGLDKSTVIGLVKSECGHMGEDIERL